MESTDALTGWTPTKSSLPAEGRVVLWLDVDGDPHLGELRENVVYPVVYGEADEVRRPLGDHHLWADPEEVAVEWQLVDIKHPEIGEEVLWQDADGDYHLATKKGSRVHATIYGDAEEVSNHIDIYQRWSHIRGVERHFTT